MVRPMADLGLILAGAEERPYSRTGREWLRQNEVFRQRVLELLAEKGPLLSREIPDTSAVSWGSTGWTNNRNVTQMLEILMIRGEVAISRRKGRERLWDLASRVYPAFATMPLEQALEVRRRRRLQSLGIARSRTVQVPLEPNDVGTAGQPAVVEGVAGEWRVDPDALAQPFTGRTALLSPFDRLIYDRARATELFDFEYVLEMYKPAAKRRWGYFALPILHHDQLIGKLDARADRKSGTLTVQAIHQDVPFSKQMTKALGDEIEQLASWLGLAV